MSGIELSYNNTDNTHTGTGSESLTGIVTYDYGEINADHTYIDQSNDYMDNVMVRVCDTLSSNDAIVMDQYDAIIRSWELDHVYGDTNDNSMYHGGMRYCYLLQLWDCYLSGIQAIRDQVATGRKLIVDLYLEACILISWMTKSNRRGVTCTGDYGFVWHPFVPLFVRKSSFGRELESRIHLA